MDRHIYLGINHTLPYVCFLLIISVIVNNLGQLVSHADRGSLIFPFFADFLSIFDLLVLLTHVPSPALIGLLSALVNCFPNVLNQRLGKDLDYKVLLGNFRLYLWLIKLEIDVINIHCSLWIFRLVH